MKKKVKSKPTIAELEKLLNSEEDKPIHILPDGSIKVGRKYKNEKVLTMKENLGGEYSYKQENHTPNASSELFKDLRHKIHMNWQCSENIGYDTKIDKLTEMVITFIEADRARILGPLVKFENTEHSGATWDLEASKAMEETLKRSGVS